MTADDQAGGVLGFNDPWHDSSFFFCHDGDFTHVESERFTRRKYEYINPMVVFCELFPQHVERFKTISIQVNGELADYFWKLLKSKWADSTAAVEMPTMPLADRWLEVPPDGRCDTPAIRAFVNHLMRKDVGLFFCGHHAAHAYNAFYSSGLERALVVTLDGGGRDFTVRTRGRSVFDETEYARQGPAAMARIYGSVYEFDSESNRLVTQVNECSIGEIWNRVLPALMKLNHGEEGTAMAMAALGDPARFLRRFSDPVISYPQTMFLSAGQRAEVQAWIDAMSAEISTDQDRWDAAAAMQCATENRVREFLARHVTSEHRKLCLAGGVFMNCQITGKISGWFPRLETIYVPPAPYDGGLAIGAVQMVQHEILGAMPRLSRRGVAPYVMGPSYSREDVFEGIKETGGVWNRAGDREFARAVADGEIVALFQGGAESGRRALGNRSIVAHPGIAGLKESLNRRIKRRQAFRPFAPMVLAEHVHEWFDCPLGFSSPYMSFAVPVKTSVARLIENVIHLDGTARVQTVHRELSPRLHQLLTFWHMQTGLPILLNTSFNEHEPIVETPVDALRTFMRTPIDRVYFADHGIMVTK
jgi:carbamoyltransferase